MAGFNLGKQRGNGPAVDAAAIETEIVRIQGLRADEVRTLWEETFECPVPQGLTKDLLVRTICWEIQERAFGGHSPAMLRLLASYARGRPVMVDRLRRLKPGTEVVREYQGERHTVVITDEGFRWKGEIYPSLSAIARAITGSNWNGPRFFGLREKGEDVAPANSAGPGHGQGGRLAGPNAPVKARPALPRQEWVKDGPVGPARRAGPARSGEGALPAQKAPGDRRGGSHG